jgi:TatD DNase family protein
VVHTARFVAELRGEPIDELAASTSEVVRKRLRLKVAAA